MRAVADHAKAATNANEPLAEAFRSAIFAQDSAKIHSLLLLEPLLATQPMCIYGHGDTPCGQGWLSPLSFAAWMSRSDSVAALVAYADPLAAETCDPCRGATPLMIAAAGYEGTAAPMINALLSFSDPNQQNALGHTALHNAIANGEDPLAIVALAPVTDLGIEDLQGRCPMSLARFMGMSKAESLLLAEIERRAISSTLSSVAAPSLGSKLRL